MSSPASPHNRYRPQADETLGEYLRRLRTAAAEVQGRAISLDAVADMTGHLPAPQRFTGAWLSQTESDSNKQSNESKLRSLAAVYSRLLRTPIPAEWLLAKAGFHVEEPVVKLDDQSLDWLLRHEDVLALVAVAGRLIELGYEEDVRLLITLAQRYLNARDPKTRAGDIFDDPVLSTHVEKYMEALGLI